MTSKYSPKNIIHFTINGVEYALHKHILQKMSIFQSISDCNLDDMIALEWPIAKETVEMVFDLVCTPRG